MSHVKKFQLLQDYVWVLEAAKHYDVLETIPSTL